MSEDELLDLVNNKDEVVGTIMRSEYDEMVAKKLGYIRSADAFLVNDKNELWIPRRTEHKRIAPNGLDFSTGEHVKSGESYNNAIVRGLKEELNLEVKLTDLEFVTKFSPEPNLPQYFTQLYLFRTNNTPKHNPEDFSEAMWISPDNLLNKLNNGEKAKANLKRALEFVALKLNP